MIPDHRTVSKPRKTSETLRHHYTTTPCDENITYKTFDLTKDTPIPEPTVVHLSWDHSRRKVSCKNDDLSASSGNPPIHCESWAGNSAPNCQVQVQQVYGENDVLLSEGSGEIQVETVSCERKWEDFLHSLSDNESHPQNEAELPTLPPAISKPAGLLAQSPHTSSYDEISTDPSPRESTSLSPPSHSLSHTFPQHQGEVQVHSRQSSLSALGTGSTPTTLPYPLIRPKPILRRQRARTDTYPALAPHERFPSLDANCQKLLEHIYSSDWFENDDPEPILGTARAEHILLCMRLLNNVTFSPDLIKTGRSLYTLFTDPSLFKCLMCDSTKTTAQRALDCVRAHIEHRPFHCSGLKCGICRPGDEYVLFFFDPHRSSSMMGPFWTIEGASCCLLLLRLADTLPSRPMRFFSRRLLKEHEDNVDKRIVCDAW
ncbi:hypothetical protein CPB86DRAFT_226465 [Serendipita vermifera]|nr:hypothetical protein CPB86DRAFT_226465 [Serendipita vermifera]